MDRIDNSASGRGIAVLREAGFDYSAGGPQEHRNIAGIRPEEVYALAKRVDRPAAECNKPVAGSSTATCRFNLRRAGIADRLAGC